MVLVGLGVFVVYAVAAVGVYVLMTALLADPPNLITTRSSRRSRSRSCER